MARISSSLSFSTVNYIQLQASNWMSKFIHSQTVCLLLFKNQKASVELKSEQYGWKKERIASNMVCFSKNFHFASAFLFLIPHLSSICVCVQKRKYTYINVFLFLDPTSYFLLWFLCLFLSKKRENPVIWSTHTLQTM